MLASDSQLVCSSVVRETVAISPVAKVYGGDKANGSDRGKPRSLLFALFEVFTACQRFVVLRLGV